MVHVIISLAYIPFLVAMVLDRRMPWQVSPAPLEELFAAMDFDDEGREWEQQADLREVIRYSRGSILLKIPPTWRPLLPTAI